MKVIRAQHLGMCFGVVDAIHVARNLSQQTDVTVLGDLVHNETVLDRLRERGVRFERDVGHVTTSVALITAHGASERRKADARARGLKLVEATCPLVHWAHRALGDLIREGYHPVIIGVRGHVEVLGLTEDLEACDVILSADDVAQLQERERFGVIAQTTQPVARARELAQQIQGRFPRAEVRFVDTVCQPTKQRQSAAVELSQQTDIVIVVGGRFSNNTRELAATCRRHCSRVYAIESESELRSEWFQPGDTVGLTAGTSTPSDVIDAVQQRLEALSPEPAFPTARTIGATLLAALKS